jgi:hypothetical protein
MRFDTGYAFRRADELERSLEKMNRRGRGGADVTALQAQVEGYRADAEKLQLADSMYAMFAGQSRIAAGALARMETTSFMANPIGNELEGELTGKSKRMKVGREAVKGQADEDIDAESYGFTEAQRNFARSSPALLGALQSDIPGMLRSAGKTNAEQKGQLDEVAATVKTLGGRLRGLTGSLVGTATQFGPAEGTAFGANLVDEGKATQIFNTLETIEGVLSDVAPHAETALLRFQHEVRNFRMSVENLVTQGKQLARIISSQRKLFAEAGVAADKATGVKNGPNASKNSLASAMVSAGSIQEGRQMIEGALDIAKTTGDSMDEAKAQILSHRDTAFRSVRGGRKKADGTGGADVKQLDSAVAITKDWVKTATAKFQEWEDESASSDAFLQKTEISKGSY